VALQEVESPFGPHEHDQLSHLAASAGFAHAIPGPTLHRPPSGPFGNAILTRWPCATIRRVDLSVPGREPRGALDVDLDCGGASVRVIATHFGLRRAERRRQWQTLLPHLGGDPAAIVVVLGDFNHWRPRDRALLGIERRLGSTPALRTFPASRPIFALDRVWLQPRSALVGMRVVRTPLTRVASDHLPLCAEVTLPD
jgi:endonuclease/exonuclease/phosphatase family metal-dependent hydrolase